MTIYDWGKHRITYPEIPDSSPRVMSSKWYGAGSGVAVCAKTGDEALDVVAYDSIRKVADRIVRDENGLVILNAAGDDVATITEFRELIITPPQAVEGE